MIQQQQPQQPARVVSARYADLKVEQTKNAFLEREKELYARYVEEKTRASFLEAENARLRSALEAEKARNHNYTDDDRQQLKKSHEQHLSSLHRQNQQLAASTALVLDALLQHYGQKLLPPHLPPRLGNQEIIKMAQQSLTSQPCRSQEEWQQRLVAVEQHMEKTRQQHIRQAIASELNTKVRVPEDGSQRLAELEFAIADCEKTLQAPSPPDPTKTETMREMVQLLKTERDILLEGLERGQKRPAITLVS
jgi:hypothetical protein